MLIDLLDIKDPVQQVANAIATVFKVDVEVIDLKYRRIAGTGKYAADIGKKIKHNHVYQKVFASKRNVLIANPREHDFCQPCLEKGSCQELAEICSSIILNDSVVGIFGLIAFSPEQRDRILNHQNELFSFITQMGEMISAKLKEEEYTHQLRIAGEQLEIIMNTVSEGIMAIDSAGAVTHCNDSGARLLNMEPRQIINKNIRELLPDSPLPGVIKTGQSYVHREIYYPQLAKKFISTVKPIEDQTKIVGAVASFRAIEEVTQLILDYTNPNIDIPVNSIIGSSKSMQELRTSIFKFAPTTSTVLISGESGTGKELFARAIHWASPRQNKPFIAINCSAIPDTLLESELFGYEAGAFTGAKQRGKPGKFEIANGGTIFLDEIGDMPLHLQSKILRTLQEKTIERLGSNKSQKVDLRIIAATNRPLEDMITRGEFRQDLYYRLNVIPLYIPPLRERKEDIPPLLDHFIQKYNDLLGRSIEEFSNQALKTILSFAWPGNVRELENAVEYAFNMESTVSVLIQLQSLPLKLREINKTTSVGIKTLAEMEKEAIRAALLRYGNNAEGKELTAKTLGIGIATLYRKIKTYQLT